MGARVQGDRHTAALLAAATYRAQNLRCDGGKKLPPFRDRLERGPFGHVGHDSDVLVQGFPADADSPCPYARPSPSRRLRGQQQRFVDTASASVYPGVPRSS